MKVFVVLNEWAYDYDADQNLLVFSTLEEAQESMKRGYEEFCSTEVEEDGVFNDVSIDEMYAQASQSGDWTRNHCAWTIFEREIL